MWRTNAVKYDHYAGLAQQQTCPTGGSLHFGLVSGFVDGCTEWSTRGDKEKNDARHCYIKQAGTARVLTLPNGLGLEPDFTKLPHVSWVGLQIDFKLQSPWYSKDDRPFHVLDNPVRKDRVFGVPYMSAASWKGLLRWACRMQAGLRDYLESHAGSIGDWKDDAWIVHLFGNEKGEQKNFQQGALAFYPTWFSKLGFEVINPHSRARRAGTQPIYYEVVPAGTEAVLRLLYAPVPGAEERLKVSVAESFKKLFEATEHLLTAYGISAKRTVGWGTAAITNAKAWRNGVDVLEKAHFSDFRAEFIEWLKLSGVTS